MPDVDATRRTLSRPIPSLDGTPGRTFLERRLLTMTYAGWCGVDLFRVGSPRRASRSRRRPSRPARTWCSAATCGTHT